MKNFAKQSIAVLATSLFSVAAFAQDAQASGDKGLIAIAAGLAIGLAALGGAIGQAMTSAAALEGIALEDPSKLLEVGAHRAANVHLSTRAEQSPPR